MLQCHRNPQAENGPEAGQVAIEDGMIGGFHPASRHQRATPASGEEQLKKTRNEWLVQPCFQRHPSCLPKNERATKFDWEMVCQMPRIPSLFGIGFSDCILVSNAWNMDRCPKKLCPSTWHDRPVLAGWPGWEGSWKQCKVPRKPWMPRNEAQGNLPGNNLKMEMSKIWSQESLQEARDCAQGSTSWEMDVACHCCNMKYISWVACPMPSVYDVFGYIYRQNTYYSIIEMPCMCFVDNIHQYMVFLLMFDSSNRECLFLQCDRSTIGGPKFWPISRRLVAGA